MTLLRGQALSKSFGVHTVFQNASFHLEAGDRIGLVGQNGGGKTTFFKVLLGELPYEEGVLTVSPSVTFGYMEQHVCRDDHITAFAEVLTAFSDLQAMEERLAMLEQQLHAAQSLGEDALHTLVAEQATLQEAYQAQGGLTYHSRTRSVLLGLGFSEESMALPVASLSGGQKAKLQLARLLLCNASVLLLDEPTNHLDFSALAFLESYLQAYKGSYIVISHDRYFLDQVTTATWELQGGTLSCYPGNYTHSRTIKAERELTQKRQYDNTMAEIHRLEGVVAQQKQWNREKSVKRAESKEKQIARLRATLEEAPKGEETMHLSFAPVARGGDDVLTVQNVSLSFGQHQIFDNLSFSLHRGERVFLLGENGCGKTSLLKTILGLYQKENGNIRYGSQITIGYYDQIQETLPSGTTVLDALWEKHPHKTQTQLRSALALFLFRGDDVFQSTDTLSGGQKARVLLLDLMLRGDNLLLLDEPTNHLDIASREALESALESYSGSLLVVSHDRYFMSRFATRILCMEQGKLTSYQGNYQEYLARKARESQPLSTVAQPKATAKEPAKDNKAKLRKLRADLRALEQAIAEQEEAIAQTEKILWDENVTEDYTKLTEATQQLQNQQTELDAMLERWEAMSLELEELG